MNVTNRRKSTDADTPTTQPTTPQQQQHHQSLLAYVSCRQAATATNTTTTSTSSGTSRSREEQEQLQPQHHPQHHHHPHHHRRVEEDEEDDDEDQEQLVTSTSSDCVLPLSAEGEGEEVTLDLEASSSLVTSPARITSSTNNYEHLNYNNDSLSLEEMPVMPTTSENARLESRSEETAAGSSSALKLIEQKSINNNTRAIKSKDMVARDTTHTTVAEAGADKGGGGGAGVTNEQASTSTHNSEMSTENQKIILKLPKPSTMATLESQHNSSTHKEDDLRKVEPLKINLHNTSSHHTSSSSSSSSSHHTPKITIKPIVKDPAPDIMISSEECSSSAEDEVVSKLHQSEPHIVPKLTIRAKNEEHGTTHSTVVPKLTIKISDTTSNTSTDASHTTQAAAAANTPPIPKLTIKTGQDGHTESIITNISPASSTTSSSSSSVASSSSSTSSSSSCLTSTNSTKDTSGGNSNVVPKLTIKPIQKSLEVMEDKKEVEKHPTIPKLCIKGNMICEAETPLETESSSAKIPKLTIKTGQEHAVIITQHNDHHNASGGGGIPKLTIKTKSLETNEESAGPSLNESAEEKSPNEKIPKITIKTHANDSPNIVTTKRSSNKGQMAETSSTSALSSTSTTPLSPKQQQQSVPKLTISRQQNDMVVTNIHTLQPEDMIMGGSIPKMTIKTQNKLETVPKLTIKTINANKKRPSTTEESGLSDDEAEEDEEVHQKEEKEKNILAQQQTKTVPKLTIKNLGSPQQKLKVVKNPKTDAVVVAETPPPTSAASSPTLAVCVIKNNSLVTSCASSGDIDEFADLLTVDNCAGESSNSQEFCGFNDNTADSCSKPNTKTNAGNNTAKNSNQEVVEMETEIRRNSDDMDIDEDLQTEHEPQVFQNVTNFDDTSIQQQPQQEMVNGTAALKLHPTKMAHIIDTVDLTSSPSRSSSPALFDYNDDSNPPINKAALNNAHNIPSTNILLERLQRETTVIQNTQHLQQQQLQMESNSANIIPPPLQPKPMAMQTSAASLKYPQLAERLMANGSSPNNKVSETLEPQTVQVIQQILPPAENIIDSIEILDTPEGSPRNSLDECPESLKTISVIAPAAALPNGLHYPKDSENIIHNNNNSNLKRHALNVNNLAGQTHSEREESIVDKQQPPSKQRRLNKDRSSSPNMAKNTTPTIVNNNEIIKQKVLNNSSEDAVKPQNTATEVNFLKTSAQASLTTATTTTSSGTTPHQRSRKQKHENLLPIAMEEVNSTNSNDSFDLQHEMNDNCNENSTPIFKRRGRPKKSLINTAERSSTPIPQPTPLNKEETPQATDLTTKSRRVLMMRKRLAIDMVDAEPPPLAVLDELEASSNAQAAATLSAEKDKQERAEELEQQKKERSLRTPLRTSRRSNTPSLLQMESKTIKQKPPPTRGLENNKKTSSNASSSTPSSLKQANENALNHFAESNSSISSACSNTSSTLTSTMASASQTQQQTHTISMASQIDLTMSSSSSNSNGSTTNTLTTVEASHSKQTIMAGGGSSNNSMLPPTTILSSEPLPDVVFKPNDFSSNFATQQLRAPMMSIERSESQDEDMADDLSGADNSGDDSASSSSMSTTPGRGRIRGRGSRGGRGRAYKAHRLGRNASEVSKAIAISRPIGVGALKHTPDPERMKGLYSPSPSVFEEDTRMSADLSQNNVQPEPPQTPTRQPDFLNNEESQSSMISNTSILDPNTVAAVQNGSTPAAKKPMKRKKMEVCVAEDADITVSSIAEYDWPPPKGCCPSKNRDTFMIQEQVALYLGIKSFKRKYPDLPRRQIDMEERNYLQEKSLVSEKMCDLGITAVWASDILDIMYTDFYDKYEEYKDFVRQKHLREIEAKQKSLGLNVTGRGLQARERAMLSTSKWNAYFNRTRKEERISCLDLQTLTINKPCPASAPIAAISYRPIADAVVLAAKAEKIPQPPTLLKQCDFEPLRPRDVYYPLSLVPGQFCQKYYDYGAEELRRFPLNTVLDHPEHLWPQKQDSTDTDSAAETLEMADADKSSKICATERLNQQRRVRRTRAKHVRKLNNEEFKVPLIPGAISTSSTDTCTSSTDSSSETDSDSSCSSSSSDDSSEDESSPATCGVCQHPQNRNLKDIPELFVQCYTCRRKVHPSCIEMPHRMATRVRNYNWQCADCKCCIKCKRKQNQNKMLFCEQCDRGFHIYCIGIKAVPDGRWSCERCSICMRCGATKPEGLPPVSATGEKLKPPKHRKLKWMNEYRIDHVTKLREHCSMLCVPCGRTRTTKRVQINTHNNTTNTYNITSPGSNSGSRALSPSGSSSSQQQNATNIITTNNNNTTCNISTITSLPQISSLSYSAATQISNNSKQFTTTSLITPVSTAEAAAAETAITLESEEYTSISNTPTEIMTTTSTTTQVNAIASTTLLSSSTSSSTSTSTSSSPSLASLAATTADSVTTNSSSSSSSATSSATVGGPPPVVA